MSTRKKIVIALFLSALLVVILITGTALFLYTHPQSIKPFIEKSLAAATGADCSLKTLHYSLAPLRLTVEGVSLISDAPEAAFQLEIPRIMAEMIREGPFGRQTLVIQHIKIDDFSFRLSSPNRLLPSLVLKKTSPSWLGQIAGQLLRMFVFRDVRLETVRLRNGQVTAQFGDQQIEVEKIGLALGIDQPVHLTGKVKLGWSAQQLYIEVPKLQMTSEGPLALANAQGALQVAAEDIIVHSPDAKVQSVKLDARCSYSSNPKVLRIESLQVHVDEVSLVKGSQLTQRLQLVSAAARHMNLAANVVYTLTSGVITIDGLVLDADEIALTRTASEMLPAVRVRLTAGGNVNLSTSQFNIEAFQLAADDIAAFNGSIKGAVAPQTSLGIQLTEAHLWPGNLRPFLSASLRQALAPLRLSNKIAVLGRFEGVRKTKTGWQWTCKVETRLDRNPYGLATKDVALEGQLTGQVQAVGRFPEIALAGHLQSDQTMLQGFGVGIAPFKTAFDVKGVYPSFEISDLAIEAPRVQVDVGERERHIDNVQITMAQGRANVAQPSLELPEVLVNSDLLRNLRIALTVDSDHTSMQVDGEDVQLLASLAAVNLLPGKWQTTSKDTLRIQAVSDDRRLWRISSQVQLQELAFQNADGSYMGEAIDISSQAKGNIALDQAQANIDLAVGVDRGELLVDRFYLNLNDNAIHYTGTLKYDTQTSSLWMNDQQLRLKEILALTLGGRITGKATKRQVDLSVTVQESALQPLFQLFVADPFGSEKPFLTSLVPGGNIAGDIALSWGKNGWKLKGRGAWRQGELLSNTNSFALKGVTLDLPLWYHTTPNGHAAADLTGVLAVQTLQLPLLPTQAVSLPLTAGPNRLSVAFSAPVQVPGGQVHVGTLSATDILTSKRMIKTRLSMDGIELDPLLSKPWGRLVDGVLSGNLDPIVYQDHRLTSRGELNAEIFGGTIRLYDLGAANLNAGAPVWQLSSQWNDLLLAEMTRETAFGKIDGLLYGYAKDIEITYGEPQRFDMLLETKAQKGVNQKISVLAVDNIAQLGGGQSPFIGLAGMLTAFLKEFPYQKIGVRAVLQNDAFTVKGTIQQDGVEYLVKRGGLAGVDVINQNPDNRVSFKDMVKRIKRIKARQGAVVQ